LVELSFGRVVFLSSYCLVEFSLVDLSWSSCRLVELSHISWSILYGTLARLPEVRPACKSLFAKVAKVGFLPRKPRVHLHVRHDGVTAEKQLLADGARTVALGVVVVADVQTPGTGFTK
jgi:hypothetical protein